ncbi:glycosyltransferase family 2 protein [Alkalinema pantanalense]|uniref:glycosyltransferase n=1 Tax=Alkalinema pantanalense TaxID=1620705 RepID=UPI003D6F16E2
MLTNLRFGIVAIGRNEGDRLKRCLQSAQIQMRAIAGISDDLVDEMSTVPYPIIYVDSGSTDDSVNFARSIGIHVVNLDLSIPFTAARARNAGADQLFEQYPDLDFVQFIDGDCEFIDGWFESAIASFDSTPDIVVVCGRLHERFPDRSRYNALCDLEWNTAVGETKECGGIAMMRRSAFQQATGFKPNLIAGEEPELCVRLRRQGGKIMRIAADMAWHDANMTRFSQWWRRSLRSGYAYAEGAWLHGKSPERHWVKETRSIWLWGLIFPVLALILVPFTLGLSLLGLIALYGLQGYRIYQYCRRQRSMTPSQAKLYAFFCILVKFPQALGQLQFHQLRLQGKRRGIIEYKQVKSQQ